MRKHRWLLFPVTLAWFSSIMWWLTRPGGCACDEQRTTPAGSVMMRTTAATTPAQGKFGEPITTETEMVTPPEPLKLPTPLVIPFRKNHGVGASSEDLPAFAGEVKALLARSTALVLVVTGHTDADGDARLNEQLSLSRAEAVKAELVALGVPAERIRTEGAGASRPIADDLTSKGKAKNRRVEVQLVASDAAKSSIQNDAPH